MRFEIFQFGWHPCFFAWVIFAVQALCSPRGLAEKPAGKVQIIWGENQWRLHEHVERGAVVSFSFPDAMVGEDLLGRESEADLPIRWSPELPGKWVWKSPTEGRFEVGDRVAPDTVYEVFPKRGLRTVSGESFDPKKALEARKSAPFRVHCVRGAGILGKRPAVEILFNYPVRPEQVAEEVYFQDRDSRKRYPLEVEVMLGEANPGRLNVVPRGDLPVGSTVDLVVEKVREMFTGEVIPGPRVFPLGLAAPLEVKKVWAANSALEPARIHIEFNEPVAASEGGKVVLEPPVTGLRFSAGENQLTLEGGFDTGIRYRVRIPSDLVGERGYAMARDSVWGATFSRKESGVFFPEIGDYYGKKFFERSVFRRGSLGIQFPLMQVNTGELRWRLARIPTEKLPAVMRRVAEFNEVQTDPVLGEAVLSPGSGRPVRRRTDLLVDLAHLPVIGEGEFPESFADKAVLRNVSWIPGGDPPLGPCLLEVSGTSARGEVVGNRVLIHFTEHAVLQSSDGDEQVLRVVQLEDGSPLRGAAVRLVSEENAWIAETLTDTRGIARFPRALFQRDTSKPFGSCFLIDTPGGTVCEPVRRFGVFGGYFWAGGQDVGGASGGGRLRIKMVPDRPLCRPGQKIRFKGFARLVEKGGSRLDALAGRSVQWVVESSGEPQVEVHSAVAQTDEFGGFEGEWDIPENLAVGPYQLRARVADMGVQDFIEPIRIEEFRPPPFLVDLEALDELGGAGVLRVDSRLFHGAPNAAAVVRWKASWRELIRRPEREEVGEQELQVQGTGRLLADGKLEVAAGNPFAERRVQGWFRVLWEVDVIGADGQTIHEAVVSRVRSVPVILAVEAASKAGKRVAVQVGAWRSRDEAAGGIPVEVEVCRQMQKSVREKISPNVFRVHRTTVEERLPAVRGVTPLAQDIIVPEPGVYRVTARIMDGSAAPEVSDTTSVYGDERDRPAEFWSADDTTFAIEGDKAVYEVGDTAVLSARAPYAGKIWVSVECNNTVLDQFDAELTHNAGQIRIPITRDHFPNIWVSVYLLRPGGKKEMPSERIARVELKVRDPGVELRLESALESKSVEPGQRVQGAFAVTAKGMPVAGADVTIFAVDEALLTAGGWKAPNLLESLYLARHSSFRLAIPELWKLARSLNSDGAMQKGFIVGDGGDGASGAGGRKTPRKNFLPVATWQTGARTDAGGWVRFSFDAPDSLTRYRIVGLAQTREGAFGVGLEEVEISKRIQIEPALPRFVRSGDEIELRAVVRQKIADELGVTVHCSGSLKLTGGSSQTQRVERDQPAVFRFRAIAGEDPTATVRFSTESGTGDAVEMSLPVHPPTLLRRESVFSLMGDGGWNEAVAVLPERWNRARGEAALTISASPWYPKIAALPLVLEYPHGCAEQIGSRILAYTVLGDLLAFLPDGGTRDRSYRERVAKGLEFFGGSVLADGSLPYWPGLGPSSFSTILGCWAVQSARGLGWETPEHLERRLFERVLNIALGKDAHAQAFHRCFALLVASFSGQRFEVLEPVARDLFARRASFSVEMRAFLAVAMHRMGVLERERVQLLREIDGPIEVFPFDPGTFSSVGRVDAIRAWAFAIVNADGLQGRARQDLRERILKLLENSVSLSTQENFWLLMAFRELHTAEIQTGGRMQDLAPKPQAVSKNEQSVRWEKIPVQAVRDFSPSGSAESLKGASVLWDAEFRLVDPEEDRRLDRGLRIERVVVNRTDPGRVGTKEAPYRLGDELEVSFRLVSPDVHHYVAVDTELPACFEAVNPGMGSVARSFRNPSAVSDRSLSLSYSQLRDRIVSLYFDRVEVGTGVAYTVVRVTSVGAFRWPPTQVAPMYDSRFSALSAGGVCYVVE